jgi:hypothetical protein
MRKRLVIVGITIGLLAAGVLGGTVLAAGDGENGGRGSGLISRVAEILGLEEQQVQDAFNQARGEIQDERLEEKLAKAVEDGYLTQEQADQLREWHDARPEGLPGRFGLGGISPRFGGLGFKGHRFFRGGGNHRFFFRYCHDGECTEKQSPPAPETEDTSL